MTTASDNQRRADSIPPGIVVERDDGLFETWPAGEGPFESRKFAQDIADQHMELVA